MFVIRKKVQEEALKLKANFLFRLQYCLLALEGTASDGASQLQASDSLNSIMCRFGCQAWSENRHLSVLIAWRSFVVVFVVALLRKRAAGYSDVILVQICSSVLVCRQDVEGVTVDLNVAS